MPLWRGSGTGDGGGGVVVPTPTRVVPYAYMAWFDPTGTEWPLTNVDAGYWLADLAGEQSAPVQLTADDHPRGGARVRAAQYLPRTITVTLAVDPGSPEAFYPLWNGLEDAFSRSTEEGPGILLIGQPSGERRAIRARFAGWSPGDGDRWSWGVAAISLFCEDPFWYDPSPVRITKTYDAGGSSFYAPYPRVSSGATLGEAPLTNDGEVTAYPIWTLTGPFASFTADNNTTDETYQLTPSAPLVAGESRIITSDPPAITDGAGVSALDELTMPGSTLWGLVRGPNLVDFVATGSGAGTSITAEFYRRFKRP